MSINTQKKNLDAQNFSALHNRYHDRLLNSMTSVVRDREAAADITAIAFAAAFKNRASFRGQSSIYTCYVACSVMWCVVDVEVDVGVEVETRFKVLTSGAENVLKNAIPALPKRGVNGLPFADFSFAD